MESRMICQPSGGATMEALMDREGNQANTDLENEEILRCKSCPPNDDN